MGALLEISDILRNVSGEGYFVHGTFLLYLILAPFVFFYPLSIAHQSMKKAKSNFLLTVSKEFNQNISEVHSEIKIQSLDLSKDYDLSDNILRIEQLQKLHDIGDSFPVWPFDFANIRRFSVSMLSPIFTFAAPFFLKFVLIPLLEPVLSQKAFETLMNILENL